MQPLHLCLPNNTLFLRSAALPVLQVFEQDGIEKIEVFNAEKIDGVWEQRLRIHYNCVGVIEIPRVLPLLIPEVTVNTRKGVYVNYTEMTELAV